MGDLSKSPPWEWDEDAIIRRDFPTVGAAPLAGEKLDRTALAIRQRAAFLGVKGPDKPILAVTKAKKPKLKPVPLPQERPQEPLAAPTPPTPAPTPPPVRHEAAVEPCARTKPDRAEPDAPKGIVRRKPAAPPPVEFDEAFKEQLRRVAAGEVGVKAQMKFSKNYEHSLTGGGSSLDY